MFKHEPDVHLDGNDGDVWRFKFPNGYQASVGRNNRTAGGSEGYFEVAMLNRRGDWIYPDEIFPTMKFPHGWLSLAEVNSYLDRIAAMPTASALPSSGGGQK